MRPLPSLSIVIPTYRREEELRNTLRSVLALSRNATEIIIVDQSPDHEPATSELLYDLSSRGRIVHIRESVANLPRARNIGVAHAQGEIVLFLDDDVQLPAGLIDQYLRLFSDRTIAGACGLTLSPGSSARDVPSLPVSEHEAQDRVDLPLCNYAGAVRNPLHFVGANMAFRREWILRAGGFSHRMSGSALGEDIEFAGRLRRAGGSTLYNSSLALWHCRGRAGGCRMDAAGSFARSRDRMRNFYYALFHGAGFVVGCQAVLRRWINTLERAAGRTQSRPQTDPPGEGLRTNRVASAAGRLLGAIHGLGEALKDAAVSGHMHDIRIPPRRVTIVVPTYNREEHLVRTLESLEPHLSEDCNLLVIDQSRGHKRRTREYLHACFAHPHRRYVREATTGASHARNVAASLVPDGILLFVDDDITALPQLVEQHLRHYDDPEVVAVGGRIVWREEDAAIDSPFPFGASAAATWPEAPVCYHTTPFCDALHVITCNFSVRASALIGAGGFHEWFRGGGEDIEFVARVRKLGRVVYEPKAVVVHHSASSGGTRHSSSNSFSAGYRKGLAFHFSALRVVGLLGWMTMTLRRNRSAAQRYSSGAFGQKRMRLMSKIMQMTGSAAAFVPAYLLYLMNLGVGGHYFDAVRRLRRRYRR